MKAINFIHGGMLGDFIHSLQAVKHICEIRQCKANVYITDNIHKYGGDVWRFGAQKAHTDLYSLLFVQPYINKFEILPDGFNEQFVNMNNWRIVIEQLRAANGDYTMSWSEIFSHIYKYPCNAERWISPILDYNSEKGKIVIHRSLRRHNDLFDWKTLLNKSTTEKIFVTCDVKEWEGFAYKENNIELKLVNTIYELADCIAACKFFIGNQSTPFALASALNVPRLVELEPPSCRFYMNESKYTNNISWFLNNEQKHIAYEKQKA